MMNKITLRRDRIQAIGYLMYLEPRRYLNLDTEDGLNLYIKHYQTDRFYLDEYSEQKELREEWLKKRLQTIKDKKFLDKFLQMLANSVYDIGVSVKDLQKK